jgi:hypothetical protein
MERWSSGVLERWEDQGLLIGCHHLKCPDRQVFKSLSFQIKGVGLADTSRNIATVLLWVIHHSITPPLHHSTARLLGHSIAGML